MALISMTGFARADGGQDGWSWAWEIRCVNGRGLDVRCRLPSGYEALEPRAREMAGQHLKRGSCQLALQLRAQTGAGELRINEAALDQVLGALSQVSQRIETRPPSADGVLNLRGVLEIVEAEDDAGGEARAAAMMADLETALEAMAEVRRGEGARLETVISGQLDEIERLAIESRDCPDRGADAIRTRIAEQIARLTETTDSFDEARLHQEAVLLASRADIREELDRLFAHIEAARALMSGDEPAGRKLDFLTQEFNREANTVCSKSNATALTRIGLELKAVIDQMREQVQNIE